MSQKQESPLRVYYDSINVVWANICGSPIISSQIAKQPPRSLSLMGQCANNRKCEQISQKEESPLRVYNDSINVVWAYICGSKLISS